MLFAVAGYVWRQKINSGVQEMIGIDPDHEENVVNQQAMNATMGVAGNFKLPRLLFPELLIQARESFLFRCVLPLECVSAERARSIRSKFSDCDSVQIAQSAEKLFEISF